MTTALLKPLSALTVAMALAAPAQATVVGAASDGYGLSAGVTVLGAPLLNLTALGKAEGSSTGNPPATYSDTAGVGLNVGANVNTGVTANVLNLVKTETKTDIGATANANLLYGKASFDGTTAKGEGGVAGVNVGVDATVTSKTTLLGGILPITLGVTVDTDPLLDLGVGVLSSTSTVTGDYGAWTASGDSIITDLSLSILGNTIDWLSLGDDDFLTGDLDATVGLDGKVQITADPNTRIDLLGLLGLAGVYLTLNEQDEDCGSAASCSIETNAFHLWADALHLGLVGLDLKLGHSSAMLAGQPSPVPLPGSVWMMLGGLGVLGAFTRRRKLAA